MKPTITQAARRRPLRLAAISVVAGADGCIAGHQAPSSGGEYFGIREPMRLMAFAGMFVLALAVGLGLAAPSSASAVPPIEDPVKARLVAESSSISPGETVWVALHLEMRPGWHVYWRNPGDAGLPPEIAWTLPPGFTAGEIAWPTPERFVVDDIGNYGYAGSVDLLVPITADPKASGPPPGGTAPIAGAGDLARLRRYLHSGRARSWRLPCLSPPRLPAPTRHRRACSPLRASVCRFRPGSRRRIAVSGTDLTLRLPAAALAGISNPTVSFFPTEPNLIDAAAEPRTRMSSDGLDLLLKRATGPTAVATLPPSVDGVLALRAADATERSYAVSAPVIAAAPAPAPAASGGEPVLGWWQALLLAFVGGAILNLMPCVFPILSLKLLGIAVSVHRAEERRHGLAYAAGVVISFAALGGLLLALRAGGAAIGWGFQLQSPVVVALLAYLLFAMGLSLSGVVEFGVGLGEVSAAASPSAPDWPAPSRPASWRRLSRPRAPRRSWAPHSATRCSPRRSRRLPSLSRSAPVSPRRSCWRPQFRASRVCCRGPVRGCCGSSSSWRFRSMRRSPG